MSNGAKTIEIKLKWNRYKTALPWN